MTGNGYRQAVAKDMLNLGFILYLAKCLLGTAICYGFYAWLPQHHLYWSIVSVLLVLAPDRTNSLRLPVMRIEANLVGGGVGLLCFFLPLPQAVALLAGVAVTVAACYLLRIMDATRSALAALVIVYITGSESGQPAVALDRMGAVILGCLAALLLTFLFHLLEKLLERRKRKLS